MTHFLEKKGTKTVTEVWKGSNYRDLSNVVITKSKYPLTHANIKFLQSPIPESFHQK